MVDHTYNITITIVLGDFELDELDIEFDKNLIDYFKLGKYNLKLISSLKIQTH